MSPKLLATLLFALAAACCHGAPTLEMIPVINHSDGRILAKLETTIYRPSGSGPFPVAILSHGSAGGSPKASSAWAREGSYLAEKGYVVLAPMRRGRGKSTGESPESEDKNCDLDSWLPGLTTSLQDIDATIEFSRTLPDVKSGAVLLLGISRGGFLSVAYAAQGRYRADIRQVVNFVGGWVAQAEDQCPTDFNLINFRRFGSLTQTPMLWLYGAHDLFYGNQAPSNYADTFRAAGGKVLFHLIEGVPENGHWLPSYPDKWRPYVDSFLRSENAR